MTDKLVRGIFNPDTGKIEYVEVAGRPLHDKPKRPPTPLPQPALRIKTSSPCPPHPGYIVPMSLGKDTGRR